MNAPLDPDDITLETSDQVEGDAILVIHQGLNDFNIAAFPEGRSFPWAVLLRDGIGQVRGGLHAVSYTGAAMIVAIWLEPGLRSQGWGRALVEAAEQHARRGRARILFAEPTTFQAADFWKHTGFEIFGRLEGLADGAALLEVGRLMRNDPVAQSLRKSDTLNLTIDTLPQPRDIDIIRAGVEQAAASAGWPDDRRRLVIAARSPGGRVVGGLIGASHWGALHVETLWVHEDVRGAGLGARLMAVAEDEAIARGCRVVYLETTSFQARPFYARLGYTQTWEMEPEPGRLQIYGMHRRFGPHS